VGLPNTKADPQVPYYFWGAFDGCATTAICLRADSTLNM
jgi:hypothetical protein